ncbi:Retrovirus-related Pol polyprotein, partial [Stylophora pistillata]
MPVTGTPEGQESNPSTPSSSNSGGANAKQILEQIASLTFTTNVPPPGHLELKGNLSENWKKWKQVWDAYETVRKLNKRESRFGIATFITCIGPDGLKVHNGLPFCSDEDKQDINVVLNLWKSHCICPTNVIYDRYKFNNRKQESHESINVYAAALRALAATCKFGKLKAEIIRNHLVCGITDNSVRQKLFQEPKLLLEKCLDICRSAEATSPHLKVISEQSSSTGTPADNDNAVDKRKRSVSSKNSRKRNDVNMVTSEDSSEELLSVSFDSHEGNVHAVNEDNFPEKKIFVTMEIAGANIQMQIDTGALCNVLPRKFVPSGTLITEADRTLKMYCKSTLPVLGTCRVSMRNPKNSKKYNVEFVVVKGNYTPLIGFRASQQMNLVTVHQENLQQVTTDAQSLTLNQVAEEFGNVFKGQGCMEGKLHLEIDATVTPVINPPRRVLFALKDNLKSELDWLERLQMIRKVKEPTEWVSTLVVVEKPNGKLRVCIDPVHLNKALKRSHYPLPVIEVVLPELSNVKVFSKGDLKDCFLHIELDDDSSLLTTFQTPWGRYCWKSMPFAISPTPELFQQKLDQNLEGLPGVHRIFDDLLITGKGPTLSAATQDHDKNLRGLLERCQERNIKLNRDKFMFKCSQVPFIGHLLTSEGLKPDPQKVEAICNMPKPEDVQAVQRFVNTVKYLSRFLEDLSDMSEPLRRLTHKGAPWKWSQEQEEAFTKIKKAVSTAPVLKFFNPNEPVEGEGDASEKGIGFALMQEGQPVTYASRSLTKAEQNYSQIEKELLAQVFGMEHNHQYVYGRKVTLWTDHKPLEIIAKKPLAAAPKRLQRLMMRLTQYDVEIKYRRGPEMYLADTLSRAYLPQEHHPGKADQEVERIHSVNFLSISEPQIQEIREETAKDPVLQTLKATILNGWPSQRKELPPELHEYFKSAQQKEPLICYEIPQHPWEKIGCDIFTFNNQDYLCTVDYFSDYFEIDELRKSKTGATVIGKLKKRFATHGIPDTFHSDNGPPFSSNEFSAFAAMYEFEHVTSSPEYPQSNGKVENAVKTAKSLMKKSASTNSDFQLVLLDWRNTPTEGVRLKNVLIDMGATCNIVDLVTWKSLKQKGVKCKSRKCEKKLFAYGLTKSIEVVETFESEIHCKEPGEKCVDEFTVVEGRGKALLGKDTAEKLNVLRVGPPNSPQAYSITRVANIANDLIIYGCGIKEHKEHKENLLAVLQRPREHGLTINEKFQFRLPKLTFFGHNLNSKGIAPTEECLQFKMPGLHRVPQ